MVTLQEIKELIELYKEAEEFFEEEEINFKDLFNATFLSCPFVEEKQDFDDDEFFINEEKEVEEEKEVSEDE